MPSPEFLGIIGSVSRSYVAFNNDWDITVDLSSLPGSPTELPSGTIVAYVYACNDLNGAAVFITDTRGNNWNLNSIVETGHGSFSHQTYGMYSTRQDVGRLQHGDIVNVDGMIVGSHGHDVGFLIAIRNYNFTTHSDGFTSGNVGNTIYYGPTSPTAGQYRMGIVSLLTGKTSGSAPTSVTYNHDFQHITSGIIPGQLPNEWRLFVAWGYDGPGPMDIQLQATTNTTADQYGGGILWFSADAPAVTYSASGARSFGAATLAGSATYTPIPCDLELLIDGLVEDNDGIPPSGNVTTDQTPSFTWAIQENTVLGGGTGGDYRILDTFDRTNGSHIESSVCDTGQTWVRVENAQDNSNPVYIRSGVLTTKALATSGFPDGGYYNEGHIYLIRDDAVSSGDCTVGMDLTFREHGVSTDARVYLLGGTQITGDNYLNSYAVAVSFSDSDEISLQLQRWDDTFSITNLGSSYEPELALAATAEYTVKLRVERTPTSADLTVYWDDAEVVTYTDTSPSIDLSGGSSLANYNGFQLGFGTEGDAGDGQGIILPTRFFVDPIEAEGEPHSFDYVYDWEVTQGAALVAEGRTANSFLHLAQILTVGSYDLTVTVTSDVGCTASDTYPFQIIAREYPRETDPPPDPPDGPPHYIQPLEDFGGRLIRYLPRWLSLFGTASAPASASLFYQFLDTPLTQMEEFQGEAVELLDGQTLFLAPLDQAREAWHLQTSYRSRDHVSVTYAVSGGAVTGTVVRASSDHQFLTSREPIFLLGDTGRFAFRNLNRRVVTVTPDGWTSGSVAPTSGSARFQIPEPDQIVPDAPLEFYWDGIWYDLDPKSPGTDAQYGIIRLPLTYWGPVIFRYHSTLFSDSVQVSLSGEVYQTPDPIDIWNRFDELALVVNLERQPGEDNKALRNRIHHRIMARPGTYSLAVNQHIAQDLLLTDFVPWGGHTTLNFQTSGFFGLRSVDVRGVPEYDVLQEELLSLGGGAYSATKSNWLPGWKLYVNGHPVSLFQYPNLTLSGSHVVFGKAVSGTVSAHYRYRNYEPVYNSLGFLTQIVPVTTNLVSGQYQVLLTFGVRSYTVWDPAYVQAQLLNPDGTPNERFRDLRNTLITDSPIHYGRARWGREANWLTEQEILPQVSYLPHVFDQVTES